MSVTKIILFGPRNVGKTTVGIILSKAIGFKFIDLDQIITSRSGSIKDIVLANGWLTYRKAENTTLREIVDGYKNENIILSLGGGTIAHEFDEYRELNIQLINDFQPTEKILLLPFNDIEKNSLILTNRIKVDENSPKTKPPLTSMSIQEETYFILTAREKYYRNMASFILYTKELNEEEVSSEIISLFNLKRIEV
jgi:shikimate kinase